jgi:hypothetical protein
VLAVLGVATVPCGQHRLEEIGEDCVRLLVTGDEADLSTGTGEVVFGVLGIVLRRYWRSC